MGASNAGWVNRNRDFEPISGLNVCCQRCNQPGAVNTALPDHETVLHYRCSKRQSLLMAGDDDEMLMTRSLNIIPKKTAFNCMQL